MMLHRFTTSITDIPLPERFTYPFCYTPHPLCILAAKEVQSYLTRQTAWKDELRQGKMFGVLIVQTEHGETGYLAAFSGILAGKNLHPFFVPPVYNLLQPSTATSGNWKMTKHMPPYQQSLPGPFSQQKTYWQQPKHS